MDWWTIAGEAYQAYCQEIGGVGFNGDKLPQWADVRVEIQRAWIASVKRACKVCYKRASELI